MRKWEIWFDWAGQGWARPPRQLIITNTRLWVGDIYHHET